MRSDADFEAFIANVQKAYADLTEPHNEIGMRVNGRGGDVIVAFERYLHEIAQHEPHAEMGHVLDAVCSLLSTIASSFATIASNDRETDEKYKTYVLVVFTQAMKNIMDPDPEHLTVVNIEGRAN